jgi:hypothetical protein
MYSKSFLRLRLNEERLAGQGGTRLRNENSLVIRLTSRIHFLKGSPVPGNPRGRESTNRVSLGPRPGFQICFAAPGSEPKGGDHFGDDVLPEGGKIR